MPILGAIACAIVLTQPTGEIYARAGLLMAFGLLLSIPNWWLRMREEREPAAGSH